VFRKGLVIFQFTLSIVLIAGTIVISRQVDFIMVKNLGYDRENLMFMPLEGELLQKYSLFKKEALKLTGIKNVSKMTSEPTDIDNSTTSVEWEGKNPHEKPSFSQISVGYEFIKTLNATMIEGRDFSRDFASDSVGFILNETAVKRLGYKDPLNKPLQFWDQKGSIIGVVKDFHFRSLHEPIKPLVIRLGENDQYGNILLKTMPGKTKEALNSLAKLCRELNPNFPFVYNFSDEEYEKLYKSEIITGKMSKYFAGLAIFISCLGLLGLAIFSAEHRTKEIGVRKVLGASVVSVFALLSKDFVKLVFIAILIATPIALWLIDNWLQSFEYRIDIHWWMFAIAAIVAVLISLLTISFQVIKLAVANPVKSLRTE
jgi:putative ABC transport system permease protein